MRKVFSFMAILLFIVVAVAPSINASKDPIPDLECEGYLSWTDVIPGSTVNDSFIIKNVGDPDSLLDWEVASFPDWGTWFFEPEYGEDLKPEDGPVTVQVSVTAPEIESEYFYGDITIVNNNNQSDYCTIPVDLFTSSWITVDKPTNGFYINNKKILPFIIPVIIGLIEIEITTSPVVDEVKFYIDNELQHIDTTLPFNWTWNKVKFFRHTLKIIVYGHDDRLDTHELILWKFF